MTMTTTIADVRGTRLRFGYVTPSTKQGGNHAWRQSPPVGLGVFVIDNSTGVSEVECRHR